MKEFINYLIRYVCETLSIQVTVEHWVKNQQLPQYLRKQYEYFRINMHIGLSGNEYLLMIDNDTQEQAVSIIGKHIARVQDLYDGEVVFVRNAITSYNRKRLIEHHVPFIVPGNQMYLPMLGIDLREHHKRLKIKKEVFTPSTQVLVLYSLLNRDYGAFTPGVMSTHLGYSAMTMTRSFDQLEAAGIGKHCREGKERQLELAPRGRQLWDETLPFFSSPVKNQLYTMPREDLGEGEIAGESALAYLTMLSEPKNPVIALGSRRWRSIRQIHDIQTISFAETGSIVVEIWKYPPGKLTQSGVVDPLSLYLSLKEIQDERVQSALYQLMKVMQW